MAAEDKKNGMVCAGCNGCGCTGRGRSWMWFLLRTLLTIIILMFVFWFGVAAGRLSSAGFERGYMMREGYGAGGYVNPGGPMMPVNGATGTPTTNGVQNY